MMSRKLKVLAVAILVALLLVAFGLLLAFTSISDESPPCEFGINLSEPRSDGEEVWIVEVEGVWGNCPSEFRAIGGIGVLLRSEGSTIIFNDGLTNGLVAYNDSTLILFADNERVGTLGEDDAFYVVNIKAGQTYDFWITAHEGSLVIGQSSIKG